jgi:hypothetical protein
MRAALKNEGRSPRGATALVSKEPILIHGFLRAESSGFWSDRMSGSSQADSRRRPG